MLTPFDGTISYVVSIEDGPLSQASKGEATLVRNTSSSTGGTTNPQQPTSDGVLAIETAAGAELAAMLRAFGIVEKYSKIVDGSAANLNIQTLMSLYQSTGGSVVTPTLPAAVQDKGFQKDLGLLPICAYGEIRLPEDRIQHADGEHAPYIRMKVKGSKNLLDGVCFPYFNEAEEVEEIHGRGNVEQYGPFNPRGLAMNLALDASAAQRFAAAGQAGTLRAAIGCAMKKRVRIGLQPMEYDYEAVATCVPRALSLYIYDYETGTRSGMRFSAQGRLMAALSRIEPEDIPGFSVADTGPSDRAMAQWSFDSTTAGNAAIETILQGFVGRPMELVIGYDNAFPFQTEAKKRLAVSIFGQLPKDQYGTVAGSEQGFGAFSLKSWSDLNRFYFKDEPRPGLARVTLGKVEDLRLLSLKDVTGSDCEWSATYRVWLTALTPFGTALAATSDKDGFTFRTCFRTTRSGFDVVDHSYVD